MNLIEQLGGYKKAKELTDHVMGDESLHKALARELLQHRRQHNIFEVGDKVVHNSRYMTNEIRIVEECWEGCIGAIYRHATDAEIKAGRRLP